MRCFFLRDGHIKAVHILEEDSDDGLIEQARKKFFFEGGRSVADGFEVWHGPRFVFRFPPDLVTPTIPKKN